MIRYGSFRELTEAFATRDGTALVFTAEDGSIGSVSYRELAERIMSRAGVLAGKGPGTDAVIAAPTVDSVIEIFASAVACRCIIMAGSYDA